MTSSNGPDTVSSLPAGWAACSLAEAVTPGRPRGNPAEFVGQPFIGLEHIEAHTTRMLGYVPAETMRSSGVQFTDGDVLYGRMRPYLNKVWLADRDGVCSGEFIVFPTTGALRGAFLKYRLNAQDFVSFTDHATTGDRPRADFGDFGKFPVLVPPLAEQQRIADRIDELFTDLAAGVAALERVKRNLSRYRAAVLHAAVTGRLAEVWRKQHGPPEEPGPKLLERILAERRRLWEQRTLAKYAEKGRTPPKNWRDRYPEPAPPKCAGREPLPDGWVWATVQQLTRGDRDSAYGVLVPGEDIPDGVPFVRIGDIRNGGVDVAGLKRIAPSIAAKFQRTFLEGGELLMSLVGTIGRTAIAPPEAKGANTARAVGVIPLSPQIEARFVEFWFRNPTRVTEMTLKSHEVARKTLNLEDVRPTLVALPPLAEQAAIVEAVNEKLSQIDALEAEVEHGLTRAARLRQAILKAAFEGRLVAQDAADEPASILLERIRAEAAAPAQRGRRASGTVKKVRPSRRSKATEPRGIYFKRAAVAAYAVRSLASSKYFGRTQLEKVLYLSQTHLRIDLSLQFMRKAAGPYDKAIHKIESLAGKRNWFQTNKRPNGGVQYEPGAAIANRCEWVERNLADKRAGLDSLLSLFKKMKTEQAELFATVYAAWNDLLANGKSAGADAIVAEVRGWHESKQRFEPQRIKKCIDWMRQHGYVPRGECQSTMLEGENK